MAGRWRRSDGTSRPRRSLPTAAERADHLRLAAGAAATRYVGNDALRLLRAAADTAIEIGDRGAAALDLAWMSIYIDRFPGIMADKPTPDEAAALMDEAPSNLRRLGPARGGDRLVVGDVEPLRGDSPTTSAAATRPSSNRRGTPSISPIGPATPPSRVLPSTS